MLRKISQTEKDKHYMISYMESKKRKHTKQNESRSLDTENKQAVARGEPLQLVLSPDQILPASCLLPPAVLKTQICVLSPNPSDSGWLSACAH